VTPCGCAPYLTRSMARQIDCCSLARITTSTLPSKDGGRLAISLSDAPQDEETLGFDIDAASNLESLIASSLAEDEPDTGLYGASLTRLTGLAGVTDIYIEPDAAACQCPSTSGTES
jgi:hypothetical protein